MSKTLIIDSSYLIFRSYFAYPNLNSSQVPTGAFYGFVKTVYQLIEAVKPDHLVFARDLPVPTWRHQVLKTYKAGRPEIEQSMVDQIPLITEWCRMITPHVLDKEGYEADDIIYTISLSSLLNVSDLQEKESVVDEIFDFEEADTGFRLEDFLSLEKRNNEVYIFSSDRDLYQMLFLNDLNFIKRDKGGILEYFGKLEFVEKYQLDPLQWVDYKTLVGDPSDNLKGLDGIGPKTATKILQQIGWLNALDKNLDLNVFDGTEFVDLLKGLNYELAEVILDKLNLGENKDSWGDLIDTKVKEFIQVTKNQKFVDQYKDKHEDLRTTFRLARLQFVEGLGYEPSSFDIKKGESFLDEFGFQSITGNKKKPEIDNETEALF